jgi:hypothetical protein
MKTLHEQEIRQHIAEKIRELSYMTLPNGQTVIRTHLPVEEVIEVVLIK